ncbi:MAG: zinc ribbon domain-containing protein [Promethearchaeota archaeon]
MSQQLHPAITQNLYEYADYMKKSLIVAILLIFGSIFTLVAVFTESLGLILITGFLVFIVAVISLVFLILMLVRLSGARNVNHDPLLVRAFNIFIATIIIAVITVFTIRFRLFNTVINLASGIMTIFAYKAIVDYTEQNFSDVADIKAGFQLYMIGSVISMVLSLIQSFLGMLSFGASIVILLIVSVVGIVSIVGQFKIANAMLRIYSGGANFQGQTQFATSAQFSSTGQFGGQPSTNTTQYPSNEPTFQSYGAPSSTPDTYRPRSGSNSATTTTNKICAMCGAPLPEGTKFCGTCGSKQE